MKHFLITLLLLPSLVFAQTKGFTVTGKLEGVPDGAEVKITSTQDNSLLAKANVTGGAFTINGSVPEPALYFLAVGSVQQHIYLENTNIKVSGSKENLHDLKIEGSKSHKEFEDFKIIFNPLMAELNNAAALVNQARDENKRNELMKRYEEVSGLIEKEVVNFVTTKKSSFVSPFLLFITAQIFDDPIEMEQRFNLLDVEIRSSNIGKALSEYIAYHKVGAIGTDAIEFVQNDVDGNPVSLSSYRGKYVLVDFWASWCKPCREENPNVVKAFKKFNNKNFTVLGVSLDKEKEPWVKAIQKDGLTWTQVSDLQFWNNSAAQMYRVTGIPQNFLIDPNGKIVGKNLRGEELEHKLCELLGCEKKSY